jgi:hypothetical protein
VVLVLVDVLLVLVDDDEEVVAAVVVVVDEVDVVLVALVQAELRAKVDADGHEPRQA